MKTKTFILICVTIFCVANVAMAQTYANDDHVIKSPNMQTALQTTNNMQVGTDVVAPMASTTYDQSSGSAPFSNPQRADANDPFGGGTLPNKPAEPGTPVGDMPWALLLILAAGYAVFRVVSNANARKRSRVR